VADKAVKSIEETIEEELKNWAPTNEEIERHSQIAEDP